MSIRSVVAGPCGFWGRQIVNAKSGLFKVVTVQPNMIAGEIIAEAGEDEEILSARIDLAEIESVRDAIPCLDRINPAVRMDAAKTGTTKKKR